jgi:hypothetical protein
MNFNGYVFTIIAKDDVPHFLKYGIKFPADYEPKGFGVGNGLGAGSLYLTAEAPNVPHNQRVYVEAIKTDTGFCVRRWIDPSD